MEENTYILSRNSATHIHTTSVEKSFNTPCPTLPIPLLHKGKPSLPRLIVIPNFTALRCYFYWFHAHPCWSTATNLMTSCRWYSSTTINILSVSGSHFCKDCVHIFCFFIFPKFHNNLHLPWFELCFSTPWPVCNSDLFLPPQFITGTIVFITVPALYNKFEDHVDRYAGKIHRQFSRHYKIVDESISRLPRSISKNKEL